MPLTATAVVTGVEGVAQIITGAGKLKKDKEALAKLKRPYEQIQNEYFQNRNLAAENAQQGIGEQSKDFLRDETNRSESSSISALLQGGGNASDITRVFDIAGHSFRDAAYNDNEKHIKNIEYFMGVNKDLAGQKTIQWGINELQPYEEQLKQLTENSKTDQENIWGGINTLVGAGTGYATGKSNSSLMKAKKDNETSQAAFFSRLFSDKSSGKISDPFPVNDTGPGEIGIDDN